MPNVVVANPLGCVNCTVYDLKPVVAREDGAGHRYVSDQGHELDIRRSARQCNVQHRQGRS
eukprot:2044955-Lingulodinium_polyedra.AAC.1